MPGIDDYVITVSRDRTAGHEALLNTPGHGEAWSDTPCTIVGHLQEPLLESMSNYISKVDPRN